MAKLFWYELVKKILSPTLGHTAVNIKSEVTSVGIEVQLML